MADFPTPGSPIKSGLFFFLLLSIWDTRSISFSLPTTGSSSLFSARLVTSLPKLSKTGVFDFLFFPESPEVVNGFDLLLESLESFSSGKEEDEDISSYSESFASISLNCSFTKS